MTRAASLWRTSRHRRPAAGRIPLPAQEWVLTLARRGWRVARIARAMQMTDGAVARCLDAWGVDRRRVWVCAAVAILLCAAGPVPGSEQWQLLSPHRAWIEGVAGPEGLCCSIADGRAVDVRQTGARWQVRFFPEPGFPTGWVEVPDAAVLARENPTAMPVAWWFHGAVRCFVPNSGG